MGQKTIDNSPPLLRAIPTLKTIGIGSSKAYALLNSGQIPAVKVGRSTFIHRDEWVQFLATRPAYRGYRHNELDVAR